MKKNILTTARVEQQLLPLYTDVQANGNHRVTDPESFAVDIIADVLIWAVTKDGGEIDEIIASARDHAEYEITNNPEQE